MSIVLNGHEFTTWDDIEDKVYTPEEIAESTLKANIICELIKAREEKNISQKELEELSGVQRPVISRIEKGHTNPQLNTLLKLLAPLGKTLAIVPLGKQPG